MDHPSRLNPPTDTTFMLIEEAMKRGIECECFTPLDLSWRNGEVLARIQAITVDMAARQVWALGEPRTESLHAIDVVWMRQDPPFNMQYITATHLLEHVGKDTKVVNDPAGVRNAPEKLFPLHFSPFMPPTLVSLDPSLIHAFAGEHGTIVAKPLYGFGGRSIFKLDASDPNLDTLIEHWAEAAAEPLMWQAFLPAVATADTRVLLVDGEIGAFFTRQPPQGSIRANMRAGGTAKPGSLSAKQRTISEALGPVLRQHGLLLVGLDLIGDVLTEINVTSPTGLRAAHTLTGVDLASRLWDRLA
jgi:glutathione synthase